LTCRLSFAFASLREGRRDFAIDFFAPFLAVVFIKQKAWLGKLSMISDKKAPLRLFHVWRGRQERSSSVLTSRFNFEYERLAQSRLSAGPHADKF
jgi:hypothetical protein